MQEGLGFLMFCSDLDFFRSLWSTMVKMTGRSQAGRHASSMCIDFAAGVWPQFSLNENDVIARFHAKAARSSSSREGSPSPTLEKKRRRKKMKIILSVPASLAD